LAQLVVLAQLLRLLEQVQRTIDVFFLQVIDSEYIANLTQLFARPGELLRVGAEYLLFPLEQLFQHPYGLDVLALCLVLAHSFLQFVQLVLQSWVNLCVILISSGIHIFSYL
jgi:hypothetical protein